MIILIDKKGRREGRTQGKERARGGGGVMERRGRERERGKEKPWREGKKENKKEGKKEDLRNKEKSMSSINNKGLN